MSITKTKSPALKRDLMINWQRPTFPLRVSSALEGLTTLFGMETGVTPLLKPPETKTQNNLGFRFLKIYSPVLVVK